jgi:hypothetical protein
MGNNVDILEKNLGEGLRLPFDAVRWLLDLYHAFQVFDDFADGDPVKRNDLNAVIWNTLVGMHQNSFYMQNSFRLLPVISVNILKWQASDTVERANNADAKSYVWRAGYYDIALAVVEICHGPVFATQNAHIVLGLYGEAYDDYVKEFENATRCR